MSKAIQYRWRRIAAISAAVAAGVGLVIASPNSYEQVLNPPAEAGTVTEADDVADTRPLASEALEKLAVKGRAPKTGYERTEFYKTWPEVEGCSLRQRIIRREMGGTAVLADDECTVIKGEFNEPYTGEHLAFTQKSDFSKGIQIDHVVALSDAWQKGAQNISSEERYNLATDVLNLLAVDASANQQKSDGDAATWLPANKSFRCQYVARQVAVKYKYNLWVTQAEHDAIVRVLQVCPRERAPGVELKD